MGGLVGLECLAALLAPSPGQDADREPDESADRLDEHSQGCEEGEPHQDGGKDAGFLRRSRWGGLCWCRVLRCGRLNCLGVGDSCRTSGVVGRRRLGTGRIRNPCRDRGCRRWLRRPGRPRLGVRGRRRHRRSPGSRSSAVAAAILSLELQNIVASLPGKVYKLL